MIKSKIRVLMVDDSKLMRMQVAKMCKLDGEIELVGEAENGLEALILLDELKPDVVVLDIEMPEMNGLETLAAIREKDKTLPVVMFSNQTKQGAATTLDALILGASDYVAKPTSMQSPAISVEMVCSELAEKIKALCRSERMPKPVCPPKKEKTTPKSDFIDIIVIGASTGGPKILRDILQMLPDGYPIPIAIVQHMPPIFTQSLAERLNANCKLTVKEAVHGDVILGSGVWIAPGGFHMKVIRKGEKFVVDINSDPPENYCRPAVDVLFRSAAACQVKILGIVLTGMGKDGTLGAQAIRQGGGTLIAQDRDSSVVWSMPGNLVKENIADLIISPAEIANELIKVSNRI